MPLVLNVAAIKFEATQILGDTFQYTSTLETFKTYWSTGNNLTSTSGNPKAIYNSSFIMNGNASLTYSAANHGNWNGMVLYTSSAAHGGTLFWKATPVFTIHGVNLNANYEKIKGRTNKPL